MRKERIEEYDIARGIAVIGMVLVHTYMGLCSYTGEWFYYFCYIPGTPFAAPVFMLLLGGNQVMTEKNSSS